MTTVITTKDRNKGTQWKKEIKAHRSDASSERSLTKGTASSSSSNSASPDAIKVLARVTSVFQSNLQRRRASSVSVALILLPKIVNLSHGSPRPMMSDPTCTRSGMLSRGYIPTGNAAHVHSHMHTHTHTSQRTAKVCKACSPEHDVRDAHTHIHTRTHTLPNTLQERVKPAHLNTMYERYTDCNEAVHARPVHRPMAPRPHLKARKQEKGRPNPQYMPKLMMAPTWRLCMHACQFTFLCRCVNGCVCSRHSACKQGWPELYT